MVYPFLKIYARLAIKIYCQRIIINQPGILKTTGPLLIAANHPNSFLDGVILTTLFDNQIYSLARGDVFQHKFINKVLRWMKLLPVYRTREGVQNLEHNYTTFDACQKVFEQKGIVLIFSEGHCENEWHLRPLKKGTARLATTAWQNNIPLTVLPLGINYSSFKKFGKEVHLNFGKPITSSSIDLDSASGKQLLDFNSLLNDELQQLVYEIDDRDIQSLEKKFPKRKGFLFCLLIIPTLTGWVLHAPFFYAIKFLTELRFKHSGHYDSVQTSMLMILYLIYWPLLSLIAFSFGWINGLLSFLLLPFTAWACAKVKYQSGM